MRYHPPRPCMCPCRGPQPSPQPSPPPAPPAPPAPRVVIPDHGRLVRKIILAVARKHDLTYTEMLGPRRERRLVRARHEAYWRCLKETLCSLKVIGRYFGNRDHTTIRHGALAHAQRMTLQSGAAPDHGAANSGSVDRHGAP